MDTVDNAARRPLIRLSKSVVHEDDVSAVNEVLRKEFLGMGAETQLFEQELGHMFGREVTCVVNGTAALHLALQSAGLGIGDEVLVPSLTYVASYQAISATGAVPISCDVTADTLTLDPEDARARITSRTRAIMPVHYSGGVGQIDKIYQIATDFNLRVIEDAAHAFGTLHNGVRVGASGDIVCFSFDGIKNLTSGEGGCIVSSDADIGRRCRDSRLLGVEKDTESRYSGTRTWEFDVVEQGWRYHMSNIMAAIGRSQLVRFETAAISRQRVARQYDQLFANESRIRLISHNYSEVVPHIYVVRIAGLKDRKILQAQLLDDGIQTGIHYQPNHVLTRFQQSGEKPLVVTEQEFPGMLTLPMHPEVSEADVDYVYARLKIAMNNQ